MCDILTESAIYRHNNTVSLYTTTKIMESYHAHVR